MKRVFIAGEGRNELGRWQDSSIAPAADGDQGAICALLSRTGVGDWAVGGALRWKDIKHYRSGSFRSRERRLVLGLALRATEEDCRVLAFIRDSDGDAARVEEIESALGELPDLAVAPGLRVAGGCAKPALEAWSLTFAGEPSAESWPKRRVEQRAAELGLSTTAAMTAAIEAGETTAVPHGSSLATWLARAERALEP